ncbi:pyruvate dehydrogenase E1 component subunit alpha type II, mitochondrial-like [Diorhabda sublineata]|uniref:pyruvate dehydrogenase E1 component subunit alpha type II, mitochondrial-like n=1 Tax=Diorhabda sublineata TaxID=1163346 RepID=UPI0024E11D5E|nr:pyruvate dehydrogenase E1 component subunit alpha type II, mitochondrial-like [Diorhabda sublineata]
MRRFALFGWKNIPYGKIFKKFSSEVKDKGETVLSVTRCYSGETPVSTPGELSVSNEPYDLHKIDKSPSVTSELTREEAIKLYRNMQTIRKMETTAANLYQQKQVRGFCHVYVGQEACAVGMHSIMRPQDTAITSYRCHGWAYISGESVENVLAELLGKVTGSARGKGGSMHIYGSKFYGGNGIVGAHVPVGTGIALAHKYNKKGAVSFTIFGDGAVDQGQIYESYNFAKLHELPVIFVIENNDYSMGTPRIRHSANPNYYTRGDMLPGIRVGGMDILAIREAGKFALQFVTSGKGPLILQLDTYRYYGHSMSDPGTSYRSREEIKRVRSSHDCIKTFADKLVLSRLVTEEDLKTIDKEIKKLVDEATQKALAAKDVAKEEVYCDIYRTYTGKVRMPQWETFGVHKNVSHLVSKHE